MTEIIYENKMQAKLACNKYMNALEKLQKKFGIWEESDNFFVHVYIVTKYKDGDKIVKYYHC